MKKRVSILLLLVMFLQMLVPTLIGVQNVKAYELYNIFWHNDIKYKVIDKADGMFGIDGKVEVIDVRDNQEMIVIPNFLDNIDDPIGFFHEDFQVVGISEYAFARDDNDSKKTIPNGKLTKIVFEVNANSKLKWSTIQDCAFGNCTALKKIETVYADGKVICELPNTVTSLGDTVFYNCQSLEEIVIPKQLTQSGEYAHTVRGYMFYNCKALQEVTFEDQNITTISEYAFFGCEALKSLDILENVETIERWAFAHCNSLEEIKLSSVKTIGSSAFAYCGNMTTATLPTALEVIPEGLFLKCTKLNQINNLKNNNSLNEIQGLAFSHTALTEVNIPSSVTKVGNGILNECHSLNKLTFNNTNISFEGDPCGKTEQTIFVHLYVGDNHTYNYLKNLQETEERSNFEFVSLSGVEEATVKIDEITPSAVDGKLDYQITVEHKDGLMTSYMFYDAKNPQTRIEIDLPAKKKSEFVLSGTVNNGDVYNLLVFYTNGDEDKLIANETIEFSLEEVTTLELSPDVIYGDWFGNGGTLAKVTLNVSGGSGTYEYRFGTASGGFTDWSSSNVNYYQSTGERTGQARPKGSIAESDIITCTYTIEASKIVAPPSGGSGSGESGSGSGNEGSTIDNIILKRKDGLDLLDNSCLSEVFLYVTPVPNDGKEYKCNINNQKDDNGNLVWKNWDNLSFDEENNIRQVVEDIYNIKICYEDDTKNYKEFPVCINIDATAPIINHIPQTSENKDKVYLTIIATDDEVGLNEGYIQLEIENNEETVFIEGELINGKWVTKNNVSEYNLAVETIENTLLITLELSANGCVEVKVKDNLGNEGKDKIIISSIDEDEPIISKVAGGVYSNDIDWIFSTTGATIRVSAFDTVDNTNETEGLQYSFNGGETWQTDNFKVFAKKTEGIKVCVKDKAGNVTKWGETLRIPNIDTTPPELDVSIEPESGWTKEATIILTAKDLESGLNRYYVELLKYDEANDEYIGTGIEYPGSWEDGTKEASVEIKIKNEEADGAQIVVLNDPCGTEGKAWKYIYDLKIDSTEPSFEVLGNPEEPTNKPIELTITEARDNNGIGLHEEPYSFDGGNTWGTINKLLVEENDKLVIAVRDKLENTKYTTINVTNIRKLDHLEITTPPDLTTYVDGQHFDPEGMVVTAIYTAGDNKVLSAEDYKILNGQKLVSGQESVTISYTGEEFNGEAITKEIEQPIIVEQLTLSNISVQTMPTKTEYIEGQNFDPTGMKIVAFYNNQFATIDEKDYVIVNGENLKYGQDSVTIRYTDTLLDGTEVTCETEVSITVTEKVLTGIRVEKAPKRTTFVEGENFNAEEMVVIATFNDGEEREIEDYTVIDAYNLVVGKKDVTISYTYNGTATEQTETTTQSINVLKKALTSIAIKKEANKTNYIASEDFNTEGLEVIAWFNDLVAEKIDDYTILDGEYLKVGQDSVTISYTFDGVTKTVKHPINVVERNLVGLKITSEPQKQYYIEGQNFVEEGLEITAIYDSGKEEVVTGYKILDGELLEVGQTTVTIEYTEGGKTIKVSQPITVEELTLTSLQIVKGPDKTTYVEGQDFDTTGMLVRVWYNNYIVQTISDYVLEGDKNLAIGPKEITVIYTEDGITVSAKVAINVIEKKLSEIKITREPDKIDYIEGQDFETKGMLVEAIYNDETSKEITEYVVRDGSNLPAGKEAVTIRYTEDGKTVSTTQRILVAKKVITKLTIEQEPTKTKYVEGQNFDANGMVVTATYNDGETKEITNYTIVNGKELAPGNVDIEITYTEEDVTLKTLQRIEVEAKVLTSIEITTAPRKIQYVEGQNFDANGMVVTATYNDGSTAVVDEYEILDGNNLAAGKTVVTIRYTKDSKTAIATQDIEVAEKVITSISVTTAPNKVNYLEGETFEKDGMVVTVTYNDGETKQVTNYTIADGENLTVEQTSVTISYTEEKVTKTVEQNITVQEKLVVNINKYEEVIDEEESYIQHITPNTTIAELLEEIVTNGTVTIYDGTTEITNQDEKVGTGMEVVITLNDETIRYTTVVIGDLNGDGEMGDADVLIMARYMVSLEENVSGAYLRAADIKLDGHYATDTDLLKMVRVLVGLSTL